MEVKYIQILPAAIGESLHHNIFINHYKTSRSLKLDAFKIPDNKNIIKLISKYELLFLNQANSSSNPSLI